MFLLIDMSLLVDISLLIDISLSVNIYVGKLQILRGIINWSFNISILALSFKWKTI
jgi:hypothetical protein